MFWREVSGVHRVPIAGDTTRLPYATGLTPLEKKLAHAQNFIATHLGGTQAVRKMMGHAQFGARVAYGDCIFFTVSPNEQHSALVLRLSRFRRNDPYTKFGTPALQKLAAKDYPNLEAKRQKTAGTSAETKPEEVCIELPEYDFRRVACARDPLAVFEAFRIQILLRLALVLGVRMCPQCPRCNNTAMGCQDKFGCNMRPLGGAFGAWPNYPKTTRT